LRVNRRNLTPSLVNRCHSPSGAGKPDFIIASGSVNVRRCTPLLVRAGPSKIDARPSEFRPVAENAIGQRPSEVGASAAPPAPLQKPPARCGDREQAYRMSNTELSIRCELIGYRGMLQMRSSE
jgi:hypothetical protein